MFDASDMAFEADGREYALFIHQDDFGGTPWENEDGHGPVSDWTTREKLPGEMVLCEDGRFMRLYDFAEAVRMARRDGWGYLPSPVTVERPGGYRLPTYRCGDFSIVSDDANTAYSYLFQQWRDTFPTERAFRAAAAYADFERLRRFCAGEWSYVCLEVAPICSECGGPDRKRSAFIGGVESDAGEYIHELAYELAGEVSNA